MRGIKIGEVLLNEYRVEEFIASGGMAVVYKVWHLKMNVPLAMKVLNPDLAEDPALLKRFRREARALQKLTHPNIVPFYGLKETGGLIFLLEKYINGPTLKDTLRDYRGRPMPDAEALRYLDAVTAALGYAHTNGVVHCDVKPGNVMIDQGGTVYLTDFGIARHADSTSTTLPELGTPAYMAPEQVRGDPVSAATDIYALGVMLFEMFTGERMFRTKERASSTPGSTEKELIRQAHLHQAAPDPRQYNPRLPAGVAAAIMKAVEKDPLSRYQSARALYEDICQAFGAARSETAASVPVPAPQPTPVGLEGIWNWLRNKNRFYYAAGIAGLVVILFLALKPPQPVVIPTQSVAATAAPTAVRPTAPVATNPPKAQAAVPQADAPLADTPLADTPVPQPTRPPTTRPAAPQPPAPTPALYAPLASCAQSHIHPGDYVMVNRTAGTISLRKTADTHPSTNIKKKLTYGTVMKVTGQPVCNYGWILWKVETTDGDSGWLPESNGKEWWLDVLVGQKVCPGAPATLLAVNMAASVTRNLPGPNNLRAEPGVGGTKIGRLEQGAQLTILDGPECADNYVWWYVSTRSGQQGWTFEGDAENISLAPGVP